MISRFFLMMFSCIFLVVTSAKAMDANKKDSDSELEFLLNNGAKVPLRPSLAKSSTMIAQKVGSKTTVENRLLVYKFWQLPNKLQNDFNQAIKDLKAKFTVLKYDVNHFNKYYEEMRALSKELKKLFEKEKKLESYLLGYKDLINQTGDDLDYVSLLSQGSKEALEETSQRIRIIRCRFFEECEMEKIKFVSSEKLIKNLERKLEKSLSQLEELYNVYQLVKSHINSGKALSISQWQTLLSKI